MQADPSEPQQTTTHVEAGTIGALRGDAIYVAPLASLFFGNKGLNAGVEGKIPSLLRQQPALLQAEEDRQGKPWRGSCCP
jgi:hypothetical protein